MNIAIIGCGDVGQCYGKALSAFGHQIPHISDSRTNLAIEQFAKDIGAEFHSEPGPWLSEIDIIISAVYGGVALDVACNSFAFMRKNAIYADFTTASPGDLREAEKQAKLNQIQFADIAIVGAIGLGGAKTPLLCAGVAAERITDLMKQLGTPIRMVGEKAGDAVALKLLRSVFTKGLEALAVECLMSAEVNGLRQELYAVLSDLDETPIHRFMESVVTTHVRHAGRRFTEVKEASKQLAVDGIEPLAIEGVSALFQRTAAAIERQPLIEEPSIENSLKWLYEGQLASTLSDQQKNA